MSKINWINLFFSQYPYLLLFFPNLPFLFPSLRSIASYLLDKVSLSQHLMFVPIDRALAWWDHTYNGPGRLGKALKVFYARSIHRPRLRPSDPKRRWRVCTVQLSKISPDFCHSLLGMLRTLVARFWLWI